MHEDLRESLDHVLVSEQFYDNSRRRMWLFDGLAINNDHLDTEDHRLTGPATTGSCGCGSGGAIQPDLGHPRAAARTAINGRGMSSSGRASSRSTA